MSSDDLSSAQVVRPSHRQRSTRSDGNLVNKHLGDLLLHESDTELFRSKNNDRTKRQKRSSSSTERSTSRRRSAATTKRKSGRSNALQSYIYAEDDVDNMEVESDVQSLKTKRASTPVKKREKEEFKRKYDSEWEDKHWDMCEVCRHSDSRKLVYCQGCAVGVHQDCLGSFKDRRHNITRLDERDYVLQCRHCIGRGGQKGGNRSYITGKIGPLCSPFKLPQPKFVPLEEGAYSTGEELQARKADEERVAAELAELRSRLYDPAAVMFRCAKCLRPAMFEDLTDPEDNYDFEPSQCMDCNLHKGDVVHLILGWRNMMDDRLNTIEVAKKELPADYLKEYLVKWTDKPYTQVEWVTASWLHGIATAKKKNFDAKGLGAIDKESDVILEDYNRIDIVLDALYEDERTFEDMNFEDEDEAIAAMTKVDQILAKWQQVQYDDVSWDSPPRLGADPSPGMEERVKAFKFAYRDWVRGFYVVVDRKHAVKKVKLSDAPFSVLEKKTQPKELVGGELMPYQMEGLNWLYYQYYLEHPAILADEMGLGKTIQIISFLSVLFTDWAIAPFLIVAPNSTISNWKREFQKWAPGLRVAAFYGEKSAKTVIENYEIIHKDQTSSPLKVHALITSYNTIESDAALLKKYHWACLIVDEGQRLKNDESILFKLLSGFKVNHRILLTGTPLQNNTKELFNLLQFLDPGEMNANELENRFDIEKQESLTELHSMLQPYFLRRTKSQVLKFLPSKNEVIVPVTMSSLQRELYKTILSKNAELMRLVMSRAAAGKAIQNYNNTSLGNVLQQIRKILSHPFIYSPDIEEKIEDEAQSLINLTNACAKLQLLKVLLPELKQRGHRVLIFCQFIMMLDILEDWMNASSITHCRIDGNTPTPERQEAIDGFNRPGSDITCFLLSTRAGGVGINLATADTVIIYDADFNPHQDLQAVARAHRIGQKKKVVVFTLVTRNTAEEKILQIGRKKMVLDQLIIENMATKEENVPYQEILSFGAAALFEEEAKNELVYDVSTVNNLIESSYADIEPDAEESTTKGEAQKDSFGFAKVWAGDSLADEALGESELAEKEASNDLWAKILAQRAAEAKAESERRISEFSKGRRRTVKDYNEANIGKTSEAGTKAPAIDVQAAMDVPVQDERSSDIEDFSEAQITDDSYDSESDDVPDVLDIMAGRVPAHIVARYTQTMDTSNLPPDHPMSDSYVRPKPTSCKLCRKTHFGGQCQLRDIPLEVCILCQKIHFSGTKGVGGRTCPAFSDLKESRRLLEALKESAEPPELVDQAQAYLRSVINSLVRAEAKEAKAAKERQIANESQDNVRAPNHAVSQTTTTTLASAQPAALPDSIARGTSPLRSEPGSLPGQPSDAPHLVPESTSEPDKLSLPSQTFSGTAPVIVTTRSPEPSTGAVMKTTSNPSMTAIPHIVPEPPASELQQQSPETAQEDLFQQTMDTKPRLSELSRPGEARTVISPSQAGTSFDPMILDSD